MEPSILTATGRWFDFENPEHSDFNIEDIASALSKLCRFTGHCKSFYSVAQHSVLVSREVPEEYAMEGLLHDAAEAFLGDVSSPLKALLPDYRKLEGRVNAVVRRKFGLRENVSNSVKHADLVLLATEARDLLPLGGCSESWSMLRDVDPLSYAIEPLSPEQARREFLNRYMEIIESDVVRCGIAGEDVPVLSGLDFSWSFAPDFAEWSESLEEAKGMIDGKEIPLGDMEFSWTGTFEPSAELMAKEYVPSILAEAESLVNGKRQRDYAPPRENLGRIASMWSALLGHEVIPEDVARCMIAVKLARDCATAKRDNAVDIAGYAQVLDMVRETSDE